MVDVTGLAKEEFKLNIPNNVVILITRYFHQLNTKVSTRRGGQKEEEGINSGNKRLDARGLWPLSLPRNIQAFYEQQMATVCEEVVVCQAALRKVSICQGIHHI